jgi:precorrin-2 methylase
MKAVELWKTARPLFERSSQTKDIIKIDAKLAEVDSAVLAKYEEQLQQLSELHVPVGALEEAYITEEEEEEEEKSDQGSDVGDKGNQGILV